MVGMTIIDVENRQIQNRTENNQIEIQILPEGALKMENGWDGVHERQEQRAE